MSTVFPKPVAVGGSLEHPRGLYILFFTEMWERFSFYGMRALLVLFMVTPLQGGGLGFADQEATAVYGLYTAAVYLAALPGGWMADRLLGQQQAVWYGGIVIACGHFCIALPGAQGLLDSLVASLAWERLLIPRQETFFLGLVLLVLGTGLLKPNISTMVGELYPEGGARRDAGFTVFYMGINTGALLGPLLCGYLGESVAWHYGFGAAGIGMLLGLLQYRLSLPYLGGAGRHPYRDPADAASQVRWDWLKAVCALALTLLIIGLALGRVLFIDAVVLARWAGLIILVLAISFFAYVGISGGLTPVERKRVGVIAVLFLGAALFWAGFEQAGSSLNLFAKHFTDRTFFGWESPASWFQSINPLFIILLAPGFAWLWVALAKRNLEPSTPAKFALGLIQLGLGFAVMVGASALVASGAQVLPTWLMMTYLLHTTGELCLSPVGLSSVTKLAPRRFVSQMMGTWFMGAALGNLLGGLIAGYLGEESLEQMPERFTVLALTSVGLGTILALFTRPLRKMMGGIQ